MIIDFEVATSYFYQIRFFKKWMIPISTAIWDPKWYHANQSSEHTFIDNNGVMNGLRLFPFVPNFHGHDSLCRGAENCALKTPDTCEYMKLYMQQLDKLDFDEFMSELDIRMCKLSSYLDLSRTPTAVFMVHEKFDNPCSERVVIQKWFAKNGIDCPELSYPIQNNY